MLDIIFLLVAALLPPFLLLLYIYCKDKRQPEPISKLVIAFFCGVVSVLVSFAFSGPFEWLGLYSENSSTVLGQIGNAFWSAAVPEEMAKLLMLWLAVRKNKYFDERLDGIVYAACVGMGFASIENVMYLMDDEDWISTGIARAFMAIPGHFFFAVLMGYFYALAHFCDNRSKATRYWLLALVVPVFAHCAYDSLLFMQGVLDTGMSFIAMLAVFYLLYRLRKKSVQHISELQRKDEADKANDLEIIDIDSSDSFNS